MNREDEIESTLRVHPGVREAAVLRDISQSVRAFVVADDTYLNGVLGAGSAESVAVDKWRKTYDLSQLTKEAAAAPADFNTAGWNSSYTRKPIPATEMREWVESAVTNILRLSPQAVYEIGTGTGLLATRIAPHCSCYLAADFSSAVLARLNEQLLRNLELHKRVQLTERRADDFGGLDQASFDTVLLNSVVQYFPSLAYLTKVLEGAVKIVRPGGTIYVGDIRNLLLLPAFSSSVELFQAANEMTVGELRAKVRRRIQREQELVISPAYFSAIRQRIPLISNVEIRPLHGHASNEMTRYRFQAILHVENNQLPSSTVEFLDWSECRWSVDEIRSELRKHPGRSLGLQRVGNARIQRDLETLSLVESTDATRTVSDLREVLRRGNDPGINPQALFDLEGEDLNFSVSLSWAACRRDGSYDAVFIPKGSFQKPTPPAVIWPEPEGSELVHLANAPAQTKLRSDLINLLNTHCLQNLSAQLLPAVISVVDFLPRMADGEVDAHALLSAETSSWEA